METLEYGYIGLFVVCFLAATILPFSSEGVLLLFVSLGYDVFLSLTIASIGNTLGGITNYGIGLIGNPASIQKLFKTPDRFERFSKRIKKYGASIALLSWLPFIGDPLTIALGFFRVPFIPVLILMAISKTLRYAFLIFLVN
jgi:membrane protein YqaA with SNARE-associated domain